MNSPPDSAVPSPPARAARLLVGGPPALLDTGLLVARLGFGGMMFVHGLDKLRNFSTYAPEFADPFGIGPTPSLALAVGAEAFASLAVVAGVATRLALVPLIVTMLVAAFYAHLEDPFHVKEKALLFLTGYVGLLLTGPGRLSVDGFLACRFGGACETKRG